MTQPTEIDRKHVMNIREAGTVVNSHKTTRELDSARAKYRGQIIPEPALAVMDAETERLAISNLAAHALKAGDAAPDFILPDAHGEPVRLHSLLRDGPVVVVFYRGGWCPYCNLQLQAPNPKFQMRTANGRRRPRPYLGFEGPIFAVSDTCATYLYPAAKWGYGYCLSLGRNGLWLRRGYRMF